VGGVVAAEAEAHPLVRLRTAHAAATLCDEDTLALAVLCVAHVLCAAEAAEAAEHEEEEAGAVCRRIAEVTTRGLLHTEGGALGPYGVFESKPWWQLPCDVNVGEQRRALMEELAPLWRAALQPLPQQLSLVTAEAMGRVVGLVEMNQVAVVLRSPLAAYCRDVAALPACKRPLQMEAMATLGPLAWRLQCKRDAAETESHGSGGESDRGDEGGGGEQASDTDGSDSDGRARAPRLYCATPTAGEVAGCADWLFAPLEGTALFPLVDMINHSCEPCVEVRTREREREIERGTHQRLTWWVTREAAPNFKPSPSAPGTRALVQHE
jgi:hypothetical protein